MRSDLVQFFSGKPERSGAYVIMKGSEGKSSNLGLFQGGYYKLISDATWGSYPKRKRNISIPWDKQKFVFEACVRPVSGGSGIFMFERGYFRISGTKLVFAQSNDSGGADNLLTSIDDVPFDSDFHIVKFVADEDLSFQMYIDGVQSSATGTLEENVVGSVYNDTVPYNQIGVIYVTSEIDIAWVRVRRGQKEWFYSCDYTSIDGGDNLLQTDFPELIHGESTNSDGIAPTDPLDSTLFLRSNNIPSPMDTYGYYKNGNLYEPLTVAGVGAISGNVGTSVGKRKAIARFEDMQCGSGGQANNGWETDSDVFGSIFDGDFTIGMFFVSQGASGLARDLIEYEDGTDIIRLRYDTDGSVKFYVTDGVNSSTVSTGVTPDNVVGFVFARFTASTGNLEVVFNQVGQTFSLTAYQGDDADENISFSFSSPTLKICKDGSHTNINYFGAFLLGRLLTDTEAETLFTNVETGYPTDTECIWPFSEADDDSIAHNVGTLNSGDLSPTSGATVTLLRATTDKFAWNLLKGFSTDGTSIKPGSNADSTKDCHGCDLTNPAGVFHNLCVAVINFAFGAEDTAADLYWHTYIENLVGGGLDLSAYDPTATDLNDEYAKETETATHKRNFTFYKGSDFIDPFADLC